MSKIPTIDSFIKRYFGDDYHALQNDVSPRAITKMLKEYTELVRAETLKEAVNNTGFIKTTSEKLNSEEYAPFITDEDGTVWTINKQSILDLITHPNLEIK